LKNTPEIFSGLLWTGEMSIDLGLVDALGNAEYVAREIIKTERMVDFTTKEGFAEHFAKRFGKMTANLLTGMENWQLR
jgi:protease-4